MTDEQPNATDTQGNKIDTPVEGGEKDTSELDKLKTSNDAFEKELIRGRELKAESQKLEAEKMLGGTSGGNVKPKLVSPEDKKINNAKEFFKDTALGDAIGEANG